VFLRFSCGGSVVERGMGHRRQFAEHHVDVADSDHRSTRFRASFVVLAVATTATVPRVRSFHDPAFFQRGEPARALGTLLDLDVPPGTILFQPSLQGMVLRILGDAQKNGQDELLPMTPDFAEFLLATPEADRVGSVFRLPCPSGTRWFVGHVVGRVGKKAGVVVNKAEGKYASAHDLRRAFGTRWAKRVMPAVLQRLMRHASIQTTMAYYVDLDADDLAADLWATWKSGSKGNSAGDISSNIPVEKRSGVGRGKTC